MLCTRFSTTSLPLGQIRKIGRNRLKSPFYVPALMINLYELRCGYEDPHARYANVELIITITSPFVKRFLGDKKDFSRQVIKMEDHHLLEVAVEGSVEFVKLFHSLDFEGYHYGLRSS